MRRPLRRSSLLGDDRERVEKRLDQARLADQPDEEPDRDLIAGRALDAAPAAAMSDHGDLRDVDQRMTYVVVRIHGSRQDDELLDLLPNASPAEAGQAGVARPVVELVSDGRAW